MSLLFWWLYLVWLLSHWISLWEILLLVDTAWVFWLIRVTVGNDKSMNAAECEQKSWWCEEFNLMLATIPEWTWLFTTDEDYRCLALGGISRLNWSYWLEGQPPYIHDMRTKQWQTSGIMCKGLWELPSQKGRKWKGSRTRWCHDETCLMVATPDIKVVWLESSQWVQARSRHESPGMSHNRYLPLTVTMQ